MSLVNTLTQALRREYFGGDDLDKYEQRPSKYGCKSLFMEDGAGASSILTTTDRENINKSYGNQGGVQIPVLDHQNVTIGNTISCTVVDSENISQLVTLSFITYAFGFTMTPAQHQNDDVKYQADFNRKMKKYSLQMASVVDSQCVATLETNKNQLWTDANSTDFGYTVVGDALQVPLALTNDIYNNMQSIMEVMDYYETTNVLGNPAHNSLVRRLQNQGASNGVNEGFQFPGYNWYTTNRVVNTDNTIANTAYFINAGTLAIENRNRPECINNERSTDGTQWGTTIVPWLEMSMGTQYKSTCADRTALNGGFGGQSAASHYEFFQFDTEICYLVAYNSDPANRYSPIVKVEALKA